MAGAEEVADGVGGKADRGGRVGGGWCGGIDKGWGRVVGDGWCGGIDNGWGRVGSGWCGGIDKGWGRVVGGGWCGGHRQRLGQGRQRMVWGQSEMMAGAG